MFCQYVMRPIPQKTKNVIASDPYYSTCAVGQYADTSCEGRITIDHTFIYGSKQVNDLCFLLPVCAKHHGVDLWQDAGTEVSKELRLWLSLERADESIFNKYHKTTPPLKHTLYRLREKYDV